MYKKLDNETWEEYLNKFNSIKGTVTVKDFCNENNISKSQFYYHKRRLEKSENESREPVFQAISLNNKIDDVKKEKASLREIKINIGNANITIPVSETTLISSIISELVQKC